MSEDHIRYDILVQESLRNVVRKVMSEVTKTGLPGDHHFFISFVTKAPGVRISERLLEQYEKEMTIVIQNQYWDFTVSETGFKIGLSFDGQSELLEIPYSAVKGFFDPSVQFGLQFDVEGDQSEQEDADNSDDKNNDGEVLDIKSKKSKKPKKEKQIKSKQEKSESKKPDLSDDNKEKPTGSDDNDKVISLDSFRKK